MRTLLLGGGHPSKGNNTFGGGCLDPQQFMHILIWGGSTLTSTPQLFLIFETSLGVGGVGVGLGVGLVGGAEH